jgi:hypothetical protein
MSRQATGSSVMHSLQQAPGFRSQASPGPQPSTGGRAHVTPGQCSNAHESQQASGSRWVESLTQSRSGQTTPLHLSPPASRPAVALVPAFPAVPPLPAAPPSSPAWRVEVPPQFATSNAAVAAKQTLAPTFLIRTMLEVYAIRVERVGESSTTHRRCKQSARR